MQTLDESTRRSLIASFYMENQHLGKRHTVLHFSGMKVPPKTVYRILQCLELRGNVNRKIGSGGHNRAMNGNGMRSLRTLAANRLGVSTRKLARRYDVGKSTIHRMLSSIGAKCRRRVKAPKYSEGQEARAKSRARKLATNVADKIIVMDDESYFPFKSDSIPGNDHFYTTDYSSAPKEVKYRRREKFPKRLLVWLAISPNGCSEPFFMMSGGAMNGEIYREECVRKRLLPFLASHHATDSILFWPDGASAHYAKKTTALLVEEDIDFVPRESNPPNLPQARPIENIWSLLKSEVYRDGWEAKSTLSLKRRIINAIPKLDWDIVQRDLAHVPAKLRKIGRYGVDSVL
jgi:hypothetical protein